MRQSRGRAEARGDLLSREPFQGVIGHLRARGLARERGQPAVRGELLLDWSDYKQYPSRSANAPARVLRLLLVLTPRQTRHSFSELGVNFPNWHDKSQVPPAGFEPATKRLEGSCSIP